MDIGTPIGALLFTIGIGLLHMVTGLVFLTLVISGLVIFTHIGGQGIQKFVRGNVLTVIWGSVFCSFAEVIARNIQTSLHP